MRKLSGAFLIIMLYATSSCNFFDEKEEKRDEISRVLSTDKESLKKILDIETFEPTHVKYYLVVVNQPVEKEEIIVVAPSSGFLQAVLYFDTTTFKRLIEHYNQIPNPSPNLSKDHFHFKWLKEEVKKELVHSSPDYRGQYDMVFETGHKGRLWFLNNKVLLIHTSGNLDDVKIEGMLTD